MPSYRFYSLDRAGRIVAPAVDADLPDDDAACARAHDLVTSDGGAHSIQVWQGTRLVHCATRALQAS